MYAVKCYRIAVGYNQTVVKEHVKRGQELIMWLFSPCPSKWANDMMQCSLFSAKMGFVPLRFKPASWLHLQQFRIYLFRKMTSGESKQALLFSSFMTIFGTFVMCYQKSCSNSPKDFYLNFTLTNIFIKIKSPVAPPILSSIRSQY